MRKEKVNRITDHFGVNLAILLAGKIKPVFKNFDDGKFMLSVKKSSIDRSLTQRVEIIADHLRTQLPSSYPKAIGILEKIMGEENPKETGMFTNFYWLMPVGKFIEKYGLDHYDHSIAAIEALTKRNTGEYAIRPYIRQYPQQTVKQMKTWARSKNFHLRRLASEGLRPKLPWASKLDLYIEKPKPVFDILSILKKDPIKFVQKSVANHLTDYIKVNPKPAFELINSWKDSGSEHTEWIIRHATRKLK
jgi:3-methyladenine DNA glycosylase AlkC